MSFAVFQEYEEKQITMDLFQDLSRVSLQRQDENQVVRTGKRELSSFTSQEDDIRTLIWKEFTTVATGELKTEFDYRFYTRYPTDTVEFLGETIHQIRSITMPSSIIPDSGLTSTRRIIPLQEYLRQWHQNHDDPFPFQNLTHCIIEDPPCENPKIPGHRLKEADYCLYVQQQVMAFFRQQNARHPEVRIPEIIVRSQRIGVEQCKDCIAEARRKRIARSLEDRSDI